MPLKDRDERNAYMRKYEKRRIPILRSEILFLLGNKCEKCDMEDKRVIDIDHVDRTKGTAKKEIAKRGSLNRYTRILKEIKTGNHNYRLLCRNCNWIAYLEDIA